MKISALFAPEISFVVLACLMAAGAIWFTAKTLGRIFQTVRDRWRNTRAEVKGDQP